MTYEIPPRRALPANPPKRPRTLMWAVIAGVSGLLVGSLATLGVTGAVASADNAAAEAHPQDRSRPPEPARSEGARRVAAAQRHVVVMRTLKVAGVAVAVVCLIFLLDGVRIQWDLVLIPLPKEVKIVGAFFAFLTALTFAYSDTSPTAPEGSTKRENQKRRRDIAKLVTHGAAIALASVLFIATLEGVV